MSFLNLPRINFSGRFFTNVSTINNRLINFPPNAQIDPGWNPEGTALFFIDNCVVNGVQSPCDDGKLLGAPVTTPKHPVHGKLVDLDPQFQQLSQVIGVQLKLATDSGSGFTGLLEPCNFQDIWSPQPNGRGIAGFSQGSVVYVSTLNSVQWTNAEDVEALRRLRDATTNSQLAIRFLINSFFFDPGKPESGFGKMIGTIGPCFPDDPPQFARRRLMPPANAGMASAPGHDDTIQLQAGFFNLDKENSRLSLDLANSVPLGAFGGPPKQIGQLRAVILNQNDGSAEPISSPFEFTDESYKALGGIVDLSLTSQQRENLGGMQAGVELQEEDGAPWLLMLAEHVSGKYVNISPFTARVVGGESFTYELRAFQWGEPLQGETLELTARLPRPGGSPAALEVNGATTGSVTTGPDGRADFNVSTPTDLSIPPIRTELASLAYTVTGPWTQYNGGLMFNNFPPAALLVWEPYANAGIPDPTWEVDVQPVFDEYMRIYPGMKKILDLSQLSVVLDNLEAVLAAISLPFDAPHRMPVTRDLSPQKIEVIQTWLKNQINEKNKC